jgi:hypothetical protein
MYFGISIILIINFPTFCFWNMYDLEIIFFIYIKCIFLSFICFFHVFYINIIHDRLLFDAIKCILAYALFFIHSYWLIQYNSLFAL